MLQRPHAPEGARNHVLVVLDSCRWDSFMAAEPKNMARLGEVEKRHSYATWTAPSHYNLLMGLMPHRSTPHVFASEVYKADIAQYGDRLGVDDVSFLGMLPQIWLPKYLREQLGYFVRAQVSMPVLNPATPLAVDFDSYELAERHNDLGALLDRVSFHPNRPTFWLLNTGETHYPYALPDEPESDWPRIHGVHGVFKRVAAGQPLHESEAPRFFDQDKLDALRARQIEAGYILVNSGSRHFWGLPFGGVKASGIGREESLDELISYTETKTVTVLLS